MPYLSTLTFLQVDENSFETRPIVSMILLKLAHFSVVIDPLVYIVYQEKYRTAIKQMIVNTFSWCEGTSPLNERTAT